MTCWWLLLEWASWYRDDTLYIGIYPRRSHQTALLRWRGDSFTWLMIGHAYNTIPLHYFDSIIPLPTYVISFIIYDSWQIIIIGVLTWIPGQGEMTRRISSPLMFYASFKLRHVYARVPMQKHLRLFHESRITCNR